ncbi:hypothetical protein [Wenjunlia tyrosinilytica]|jgi:hypothetical protein|nr:hypothetical protein [Wenjunlia tyrosinilytica]
MISIDAQAPLAIGRGRDRPVRAGVTSPYPMDVHCMLVAADEVESTWTGQ